MENSPQIYYGSMPIDDGHLILNADDVKALLRIMPKLFMTASGVFNSWETFYNTSNRKMQLKNT